MHFISFDTDFIIFKGSTTAAEALLYYISTPADIASGTDSELDSNTHPAIVQYAYAELLKRADRLQESSNEFGVFAKMIEAIK